MIPAPSRLPTMPAAFSSATTRIASAAPASARLVVSPVFIAGAITWSVTRPRTYAEATVITPYTALLPTDSAKIRGSCRIARPRTPNPRRIVSSRGAVTAPPSVPVTAPPYDQVVTTLSRTERDSLADLLTVLGPEAPTLCGDWSTRDLAAHMVVRERRPDTLPGIRVKLLSGHTESVRLTYARRPYAHLVAEFRSGPGRFSALALPGIESLVNTTEYAIHHEDVRRAQPDWEPRDLPVQEQDVLWKVVAGRAKLSFRSLGSRVVLRRTDRTTAEPVSVGSSDRTVELAGEPLEVLLYIFGRREHARVEVTGDPAAVAALTAANLAV